ncbi:hypothetical protein ACLEPN_16725 [Myxococcus sp. 1LA]
MIRFEQLSDARCVGAGGVLERDELAQRVSHCEQQVREDTPRLIVSWHGSDASEQGLPGGGLPLLGRSPFVDGSSEGVTAGLCLGIEAGGEP